MMKRKYFFKHNNDKSNSWNNQNEMIKINLEARFGTSTLFYLMFTSIFQEHRMHMPKQHQFNYLDVSVRRRNLNPTRCTFYRDPFYTVFNRRCSRCHRTFLLATTRGRSRRWFLLLLLLWLWLLLLLFFRRHFLNCQQLSRTQAILCMYKNMTTI